MLVPSIIGRNPNSGIFFSYPGCPTWLGAMFSAAKTPLDNHVTTEERILTLDKNCEYCQIYFKE